MLWIGLVVGAVVVVVYFVTLVKGGAKKTPNF